MVYADHLCIDASFLNTAQHYCGHSGQWQQHQHPDVPLRVRKSIRTSHSGCKVRLGLAWYLSHSLLSADWHQTSINIHKLLNANANDITGWPEKSGHILIAHIFKMHLKLDVHLVECM